MSGLNLSLSHNLAAKRLHSLGIGGSGGIGAHRYWKWTFYNIIGSRMEIAAVGLYEIEGGPNLAATATLSVSSQFSGYGVANLVDGNASTVWATSDAADGITLKADLGAGNDAEILYSMLQGGPSNHWDPRRVVFAYSDDDVTYTQVFDAPFVTFGVLNRAQQFDSQGTYPNNLEIWKIDVTANGGGSHTSIADIQLLSGGIDMTDGSGVGAFSNGHYNTYNDYEAFDSSTTNQWVSSGTIGSIGYYFHDGNPATPIDQVSIKINSATEGPTAFTVKRSVDNGATFTTVLTQNGLSWSANERKTFTV